MTVSSVLLLGLVVLIPGVIWCYLRFIRPYLKLPTSFRTLIGSILLCGCCLVKGDYAHKNILRKIKEISRKYEKEGLFVAWFNEPMVFVFGQEFVKKILNEPTAINKPKLYSVFNYFIRNSIFLSNGKKWKSQKKVVKHAFQFALRQKKIQIIHKHSRNLVKILSIMPNNTTNDILNIVRHSTMQIIFESMFGAERNFTDRSCFIEFLDKVFSLAVERIFKPWLYPDFSLNFSSDGRKCLKGFKRCSAMLSEMMETMIENMPKDNLSDMKPRLIGETLLKKHLEDPSGSMDELMAQILLLILGAFDTTSLTLMWCLYLLGFHEEVQERIISEVNEFNEHLAEEDLRKMEYTEWVIRESMRIYGTAPIIFKILGQDVQCGKYTIPKGSTVVLATYILHKNPDMFPDPEKFDPERFRQTENGDASQLYTASFAEGLRPCVGKVDALIELKIMIAYIVRNFKIVSLDKQKDVEVSYEILLQSVKPLQMQFIPRRVVKQDGLI